MGSCDRLLTIDKGMMKISIFALLATVCVAVTGSEAEPSTRINCQECVDEMHHLGGLIRQGAPLIENFLKGNYCPTLDGHVEQCQEDLAHNYVGMLFMIIQHYFVDGAVHICQAWGVCDVETMIENEPRRYTCAECVEGLEWVQGYMEDPLWIAEYTLYLEQNFCVNKPQMCPDVIKRHFPPMHQMAMEEFWDPQNLCDMQAVCGGEGPTKPPAKF